MIQQATVVKLSLCDSTPLISLFLPASSHIGKWRPPSLPPSSSPSLTDRPSNQLSPSLAAHHCSTGDDESGIVVCSLDGFFACVCSLWLYAQAPLLIMSGAIDYSRRPRRQLHISNLISSNEAGLPHPPPILHHFALL